MIQPPQTPLSRLERLLIPRALLDDETTATQVRPLVSLTLLCLCMVVLYATLHALILPYRLDRLVYAPVVIAIVSLALFLIRRQRVILARHVLLYGTWATLTAIIWTSGGTRAPAFGLYTLVVLGAASYCGWRQAAFISVLTVLTGLIIALVDRAGYISAPFATPLSAWLTQSTTTIVAAAAAFFMLRHTQLALQRAQQALAEREEIHQELRKSEERFRLITSLTSDYSFSTRVSPDGALEHTLLSGAFETITGYTPEEYLAIGGWRAVLHPDDRAQDAQDMAALQRNERVISEIRTVAKDGAVRWVRVYAYPVWDAAENRLVGINGAVQDITERKRAEAALYESEKRYRVISEMISDYAYAYDIHPDGSFTPCWITAESFQRMTGYTWDEIGSSYNLYHADDAERARHDVEQTLAGHPISGEYRIVTKGGELRWVHIRRGLEWDEQGRRPVRVYGAAQDITEPKRLEAALRQHAEQLERLVDERTDALHRTKEQLELVLNNTVNALAFADPRGDILVANPAYRALFSERGAQAIEFVLWSLSDEEQIALLSEALLKAIYDRERQQMQAQIEKQGAPVIDLDLTLTPVAVTADQSRSGVLLSGHDITHLKEIERFKARFVADAVHDLATPITGLSTRLYLLQRDPERLAHHVRALENQVLHLRNLLDDLRTLSQIDRGQIALSMVQGDLNEVVRRVFDTYEPVAHDKQQTLTLSLDSALPPILFDPRQIERVLMNLIANAVSYTPPGETIGVETARAQDAVVITVTDRGIGISAQDLPHVFDRFYRTATARDQVPGGTGLGLAITREIVALHGGTVSVVSVPGQGSTFTVRLPL